MLNLKKKLNICLLFKSYRSKKRQTFYRIIGNALIQIESIMQWACATIVIMHMAEVKELQHVRIQIDLATHCKGVCNVINDSSC